MLEVPIFSFHQYMYDSEERIINMDITPSDINQFTRDIHSAHWPNTAISNIHSVHWPNTVILISVHTGRRQDFIFKEIVRFTNWCMIKYYNDELSVLLHIKYKI